MKPYFEQSNWLDSFISLRVSRSNLLHFSLRIFPLSSLLWYFRASDAEFFFVSNKFSFSNPKNDPAADKLRTSCESRSSDRVIFPSAPVTLSRN